MEDKTIIKISVLREANKEAGYNTAAEYFKKAEEKFLQLVEESRARATANGRKTLQERDL